jgi:chromosome transmission fidelity protein 1
VFDEAHNLMETITSMNTVSVSLSQLSGASSALQGYLDKYGSRLAPKNQKSLKDIHSFAKSLEKFLQTERGASGPLDVMDMLIETDLYKHDFRKTHEFFERADIVRKVNGYVQS